MNKKTKSGWRNYFEHKFGKGSRVLSLALSASMVLGSAPTGALTTYAESQIIYGSSDDEADESITFSPGAAENTGGEAAYEEGTDISEGGYEIYEDSYPDEGNVEPGVIYGTDEEPVYIEEIPAE